MYATRMQDLRVRPFCEIMAWHSADAGGAGVGRLACMSESVQGTQKSCLAEHAMATPMMAYRTTIETKPATRLLDLLTCPPPL